MWSMVAQRLTHITPLATPDQLWQRVEAAWSAVPQEHIQSLFESMPRRVNGRWRSGRYERKFRSSVNGHGGHCVRVVRLMVHNDESGAVTADLTINLSSQFAVALGRSLPS
ncbi:hypothetical protein TNCV_3265771 [Trichonephila clavipes]|nr:hypothetical protein TNCV_3265771 [Trichonephila clavipes]